MHTHTQTPEAYSPSLGSEERIHKYLIFKIIYKRYIEIIQDGNKEVICKG